MLVTDKDLLQSWCVRQREMVARLIVYCLENFAETKVNATVPGTPSKLNVSVT